MYLNHLKFTVAVVLLTLVIPLLYCLALITNTNPPTYAEIKNSFVGAKDDIYYK